MLLAADVFSLGASIYEVATRVPLEGSGPKWHALRDGGLPEVGRVCLFVVGMVGVCVIRMVFMYGREYLGTKQNPTNTPPHNTHNNPPRPQKNRSPPSPRGCTPS